MALLQIGPGKEGGDSLGRRKPRPAVGIDLGTTNSLVAMAAGGTAKVIGGPDEVAIVPSVVSYGEEGVVVGDEARRLDVDPDNTFSSVKRLIGKSLDEIKRSSYKFQFVEGEGTVRLKTRRGPKTPVEMSAEILRVLRERAEAHAGEPVRDAVITVPAYFDDAQRQATKDAASLAGLEVLRLLNEPTAAAIAYGLDSGDEGIHVVYDLGGGTFDVSVLRLTKGVFEVMATGGDAALGGDDFDALLARSLLDKTGIAGEPRSIDWRRALESAQSLKEKLTDTQSASVECNLSGGALELSASRDEVGDIFSGLVGRTISILKGVMQDAKLRAQDVDAVVLVGGSTRMPLVREAIRGHFGLEPKAEIDPDQVVAVGAAIQADVLAGNRVDGPLLLDVIPLSLGIEIGGGLVERIVPRNTTVPIARAQHFTTQVEGQTKIKIHVVQGERELAEKCRSLAQFDLSGIPPLPAGTARVKVTFQVDMDGLLTVSAVEESTDSRAKVEVKPSYGLEESEIAAMLEQSYAHAADDRDERSLIESREEAIQMVTMLKAALERDGARLMDADALAALRTRVREVEEIASGKDADRIREACKLLDEESAEFAEKRMDMAIKSTLKGKRVEEVGS